MVLHWGCHLWVRRGWGSSALHIITSFFVAVVNQNVAPAGIHRNADTHGRLLQAALVGQRGLKLSTATVAAAAEQSQIHCAEGNELRSTLQREL